MALPARDPPAPETAAMVETFDTTTVPDGGFVTSQVREEEMGQEQALHSGFKIKPTLVCFD